MNKKILIIIGLAALTVIAFLLFGKPALSPHRSLFLSQPIATNFRYPAQLSPTEAYYFNGSTFLSYNLTQQTSKPLSPIFALPNVLDVQWSKSGALFKATSYSVLDQLKPILDSKNLPTNSAYWWSVNFATSEIKLIGAPHGPSTDEVITDGTTISSTIWASDGQKYYYIQTSLLVNKPAINTVYVASLDKPPQPLAQIDGHNLVWADQSRIIYKVASSKTHTLNQFNIAAKTTQVIYDNFSGPAYINTSGSIGLVIPAGLKTGSETLAETNGPLQLLTLGDSSKPKVLDAAFSGTVAWSRSADAWAAVETVGKDTLTGYSDDGSGKVVKLVFKLTNPKTPPPNLKVIAYENDQILLLDSSNNAYLASVEQLNLKAVEKFNPSQWSYSGTDSLMTHGLTNAQLGDLKYALYQFALSASLNPKKVDIRGVTIEPFNRKNPTGKAIADFDLTLDNNHYRAKMEYFDLASIRLYLTDPKTNQQIYDSQTINNRNLN